MGLHDEVIWNYLLQDFKSELSRFIRRNVQNLAREDIFGGIGKGGGVLWNCVFLYKESSTQWVCSFLKEITWPRSPPCLWHKVVPSRKNINYVQKLNVAWHRGSIVLNNENFSVRGECNKNQEGNKKNLSMNTRWGKSLCNSISRIKKQRLLEEM